MDTRIDANLKGKIQVAPETPGCYLYIDKTGTVIYVGKAKMLRNRVRSYFHATDDEKVQRLIQQIADVEYFTTETETDALLHEHRLIKQYKPWFNRQLKRDTPHPLIMLNRQGKYATLSVVPKRGTTGAKYFDCFHDEQDAKDTLAILQRAWRTPSCGQIEFGKAGRACLNYHLGACMAPCEGKADEDDYAWAIADIVRLFEGKRVSRMLQLEQEMHESAEALAYEKAGEIKQLLGDLERLQRKARRMFHFPADRAVLVFLRAYREAGFTLYLVRNGAVQAQKRFDGSPDEAGLADFINEAAAPSEPGPPWLADAIREIYADKLFVPLPARCGRAQIEKAIHKHWTSFLR
ncbi:GIY-YIG nuclease family protein [Ruminococcaceae bacterium OttesenSCG-928-D13]|nr:GIY-YIG nuclease family protein [Ruminococcaceae bacterium OttesenSCG-928-D13]